VSAIVLPILGGVCGWIAFEMSDKVSRNKEAEMTSRIAQAEAAARPKPFRERLIAQLNAINPSIIAALKTGRTNFSGDFLPHHFTDLQRLASEPGANVYISFRGNGVLNIRSDVGQTNGAVFTLNPSLLKE
jgi:hypothetical protein